jgi:hypothetical protein
MCSGTVTAPGNPDKLARSFTHGIRRTPLDEDHNAFRKVAGDGFGRLQAAKLGTSRFFHEALMTTLTNYLSKLLGLFSILVGLAMIARLQDMVGAVDALMHNPTLLLIVGLIALGIGLAMVLAHNVWSGGVLPVVVTIIGWLILIRGLVLLFLPAATVATTFEAMHFSRLLYLYASISLILGLYLTFAGFRGGERSPQRAKRR